MNTYAATAMMQEAHLDARRFLIVVHSHHMIREAIHHFSEVNTLGGFGATVRRANGAERVDLPGGGCIRFATPRGSRIRGLSVDVVFIDNDAHRVVNSCDLNAVRRFREDVALAVMSRAGKVVHS